MARFKNRFCWLWIAAGIASCISPLAYADDSTARAVLQRWEQTLRNSGRLAVRFRSERIDHVFLTKEERLGVFYRDEQGNAAFRLGECLDRPLSAIDDINPKFSRVSNSRDPGLICVWSDSSIGLGFGTYIETTPIQPASAKYPDNSGNHSNWFFNSEIRLRQWQIHYSAPHVFPFVFCESPEVGWYDAKLLTNPNSSDVCLRLSLPPESPSDQTPSVDALFRPGESLPFAVRRFDPPRTTEFRFFIESIQTGEKATIPDDAFQLTTDH